MPERRSGHGTGEEEVDDRIVELGEQPEEGVPPLAGRDGIGSVPPQSFVRVDGTQSRGARRKIGHDACGITSMHGINRMIFLLIG